MKRLSMGGGIALLILVGAGVTLNAPPGGARHGILIIEKGAPAARVAIDLERGGWVRSRRWVRGLMALTRSERRLKAGAYRVRSDARASSILRDIVQGRTATQRVTIPEGWASWQIADRLEALGVCPAADFRRAVAQGSAEGELFPETYYFDGGTPADAVCAALRARFRETTRSLVEEALRAGDLVEADDAVLRPAHGRPLTRTEWVTLASIVEREAHLPEERSSIAAVYLNRLQKRMPLEADPTVQFALGYWKDRLTYADLKVESPYNTYRRYGLPPGPICSPGRLSLAAVLSPAKTAALFFVADGAGGHSFSTTYAEHLRLVRQRRRARALKKARAPLN